MPLKIVGDKYTVPIFIFVLERLPGLFQNLRAMVIAPLVVLVLT